MLSKIEGLPRVGLRSGNYRVKFVRIEHAVGSREPVMVFKYVGRDDPPVAELVISSYDKTENQSIRDAFRAAQYEGQITRVSVGGEHVAAIVPDDMYQFLTVNTTGDDPDEH